MEQGVKKEIMCIRIPIKDNEAFKTSIDVFVRNDNEFKAQKISPKLILVSCLISVSDLE